MQYFIFAENSVEAVREAYERADRDKFPYREDRLGILLLGKWEVEPIGKPYLITLVV